MAPKIKIAICDDEDIFRKHFRELLLKESFVQNTDIQVWECASGEELLAACSEAGFHADVIFLDIRMKGMDGMETARILRRRGEKCLLVFLTSLSEYAAKGYEVKAFRYLMKEDADRELGQMMKECVRELEGEAWLAFSRGHCHYSVPRADILYFESRKRQVYLYTEVREYSFYEKLDAVEALLAGKGFLRCHRSFLVNMDHVSNKEEGTAVMRGGGKVLISRRKQREFTEKLLQACRKEHFES